VLDKAGVPFPAGVEGTAPLPMGVDEAGSCFEAGGMFSLSTSTGWPRVRLARGAAIGVIGGVIFSASYTPLGAAMISVCKVLPRGFPAGVSRLVPAWCLLQKDLETKESVAKICVVNSKSPLSMVNSKSPLLSLLVT
jgi:hypothetical protein